jgi:hypothetical protein
VIAKETTTRRRWREFCDGGVPLRSLFAWLLLASISCIACAIAAHFNVLFIFWAPFLVTFAIACGTDGAGK